MRYILILISICCFNKSLTSQAFINGNFENNTANGIDQINLSNAALNAMLQGVTAFGSYGDVDIINSANYGGSGAQDKQWYVALTGGGTDIISLELTQPLVAGKTYSISFYDRATTGYQVNPIQIGLSSESTNFGTVIYTSPEKPVINVWTQRSFTFIAKTTGKYITVQMPLGGISDWVNLDNFVLNNTKCNGFIKIDASKTTINKGDSLTLIAFGGLNYTWTSSLLISAPTTSAISVTPQHDCIYTVSSKQEGCPIITATVAINVIEPKKDSIAKNTKCDSVRHTVVKNADSTRVHRLVKFNRHKLNGRKLLISQTVEVSASSITIAVWDKNRMDGDIVSIYLNGELIEENVMVLKTQKEITLQLQEGSNLLVMEAVNMGKIPPNTAGVKILSGKKNTNMTLISDMKKSGAIEIMYTTNAVTIK